MDKKFKFVTRKTDVSLKKQQKINLEKKISYYSELSSNELIKKSKEYLEKIIESEVNNDFFIDYEAIMYEMDKRNILSDYTYKTKNKYYPDYYDKEFNEKIYKKLEFYLNKNYKTGKLTSNEKDILSKQLCDPLYETITGEVTKENVVFNLSNNQKFLKAYLSPSTPYNSMLIYHGTGVGKTCTSISIAEQYSDEIQRLNKKIIILLNPSIKANFIKNIFNINKFKAGLTYYQCTGDKYLKEIPDFDKLPIDLLEKKIAKIIKKRYEFYGYQQFANLIEKIDESIKEKFSENLHEKVFKKKIDEMFSNTVFIIDEVHNIKEGESLKVLPPLLERVFNIVNDTKLLLLSATPMFDNSKEIIFLMNLLLRNDNKPLMNSEDYFDSQGNLIKEKEAKFLRKTQGYISYARGEDPIRFPKRIYPTEQTIKKYPTSDKFGIDIKENEMIKELNIIPCVMSGLQKTIYEKMEDERDFGSFNKNSVMVSNVVFPNGNLKDSLNDFKLDSFIGDRGFDNIFSKKKVNKNLKFMFKNEVIGKDFFDNIKNYSSKISKIIENVKKSSGVVFIYSQYIASGILPLACLLEHNGYKKYGSSLLNTKIESKTHNGNYIVISGNDDLSRNAYHDYLKIESKNKDGEVVKIIIGSETAAEGLDFRFIREVHILEPWFHLNKLDQIIGRASRNCSHIDLKLHERTVKIFLYALTKSLNPSKELETTDIEIYRKAEQKTKQMSEIEYLLKINAVDCNLNIESNKYETDKPFSKECNYKESCDYKCVPLDKPQLPEVLSDNEINRDTLTTEILKDQIDDIIKIIKLGNNKQKPIFKQHYFINLKEIINKLKINTKIDDKYTPIIFLALHNLILNKEIIKDKNNNPGRIIFRNGYYIFIPLSMENKLYTRSELRTKKNEYNKLNISNNKILNHFKNNKPEVLDVSKTVKPLIVFKTHKNNSNKTASLTKKQIKFVSKNNTINKEKNIVNDILSKIPKINTLKNNILKETFGDTRYKKIVKDHPELLELNKIDTSILNEKEKLLIKTKSKLILQDELLKINSLVLKKGLIMDYVKPQNKKIVIEYFIKNKDNLNPEHKLIFENCYNILYYKNDVYYKDSSYKGDNSIFGYKIIIDNKLKYFKYIDNKFIKASKEEEKLINKSKNKQIKESKKPALLVGYLEKKFPEEIDNEVIFKIRDKRLEGEKGTEIKKGSVCNNDGMPKKDVISLINSVNSKSYKINGNLADNVLCPGKKFLCNELELYFRYFDTISKDNKRHFFNSEETIEYKLNEYPDVFEELENNN